MEREVSIREASDLTRLSEAAVRARVNRGSLPSRLEGGRRLIPIEALYAQGLIPLDPGQHVSALLDRLERQAEQLGRLRERLGEPES